MSGGISALADYVREHAIRGACRCGKCVDAPSDPDKHQPNGHTASVFYFDVSANGDPDPDTLRSLISSAREGYYADVDLFDGEEHGYIELGAWIGDQGLALTLIALGHLMGLWTVMHPGLLPIPDDLKAHMAGSGMVAAMPLAKAEDES